MNEFDYNSTNPVWILGKIKREIIMKRKIITIIALVLVSAMCIGLAGCRKNTPKTVSAAKTKMNKAGYTVTEISDESVDGIECLKDKSFIHAELCSNLSQAQAAFDLYKNWTEVTSGFKVGKNNLWVYYGTQDAIDKFFS